MDEKELMSLSDDEKMERLKDKKFNYLDITSIVLTLKSDEKKIEAMNLYLKNVSSQCLEVISSLSSVENKLNCIDILELWDRSVILSDIKLENDEQRFRALEIAIKNDFRFIEADIIYSMSEENIIRAVSLIQGDYERQFVIERLSNDEIKIKLLETIDSEFCKAQVISSLHSDERKFEQLEKLNEEFYKAIVIASLDGDVKKIEQLEKLSDENSRTFVIISIDDDIAKLEQLETLRNEENRSQVIVSLHDDVKKLEQLKSLINEENRANVIASLQNDEFKVEQLRKIKDEALKKMVIFSLSDTESKIEQLELLSNEFHKADIISLLNVTEEVKIEQLEKLNNECAKAIVIDSLYDEDKKIEQLERLSDDTAKTMVICTLQDSYNMTEQAEKLNNDYLKVIISGVAQSNGFHSPTENLAMSRDNLRGHFLNENRTYTQIGLDKRITIGMEIESEGFLSKIIGNLHKIATTQDGLEIRGWDAKGDASLDNGIEVVSPILTDNKEDVEDIYTICSIMQKLGQQTSQRCGGHVHIGADYLTSKEAYINLFEIWGNTEKIIYKMSNEKGTIPRMGMQKYASPLSPKLNEAIERETINIESEEDLDSFISDVKATQGKNRYSGLNLLNINNGKNTIEFRVPNGTINPDTWIENARLFGRIVQMSQRLAEIEKQPEKSQENEKLLELKERLKEEIPEQEKMEILLELLFTEEEREVYRERYISSTKILAQISDEKNPFQQTKFSYVDFKKKKHGLDEFYEVVVNERMETANEATRETVRGVRTEEQFENAKDNDLQVK